MRNLLCILSFALFAVSCNQNNTTTSPNNNPNNPPPPSPPPPAPTTFFKAKVNGVWYQNIPNNIFTDKIALLSGDSLDMISCAGTYSSATYNMKINLPTTYAGVGSYSNGEYPRIHFDKIPMDGTGMYSTGDDTTSTVVSITSDNGVYMSGTFSGNVINVSNDLDTLKITEGSFTVKYLDQM